jgi:hypothetical protein
MHAHDRFVYSIEFQHLGLPHAHILVALKTRDQDLDIFSVAPSANHLAPYSTFHVADPNSTFNPYLVKKYDAHVYCRKVQDPKAVVDYIFKIQGSKRIAGFSRNQHLGVYDAAWRIQSFSLARTLPAVLQLDIVAGTGWPALSPMLVAFFDYCRQNPTKRMTYLEAPEHLVWTEGRWQTRNRAGGRVRAGAIALGAIGRFESPRYRYERFSILADRVMLADTTRLCLANAIRLWGLATLADHARARLWQIAVALHSGCSRSLPTPAHSGNQDIKEEEQSLRQLLTDHISPTGEMDLRTLGQHVYRTFTMRVQLYLG